MSSSKTSDEQRVMLFRFYNRACKHNGWKQNEAKREEITLMVFKKSKSWKKLSNADIDLLKAHLTLMFDPNNLDAQLVVNGDTEHIRKRLVIAIESYCAAFSGKDFEDGEDYIQSLCLDLTQGRTKDWRNLPIRSLRNFHITVKKRAESHAEARKEADDTGVYAEIAAEDGNPF